MSRKGGAGALALAIIAAQAGHLLAYQLRFGTAAQQIQSSGAHAYFPTAAKTMLGIAAVTLLSGLFLFGLARVASGRPLDSQSTPGYLRTLAALFTLQLGLFVAQETCEALLAGVSSGSVSDLILWGSLGQLPVAAVAALAVRWLSGRVRPAVAVIRTLLSSAEAELDLVPALIAVPVAQAAFHSAARSAASAISRRGPPSF